MKANNVHGNLYGTSIEAVAEIGRQMQEIRTPVFISLSGVNNLWSSG